MMGGGGKERKKDEGKKQEKLTVFITDIAEFHEQLTTSVISGLAKKWPPLLKR